MRFIDTGTRIVKDTPLLFQPAMVRAAVRHLNPKVVTRRLHKGEGDCPYGESGDRLWGKESYRLWPRWDRAKPASVPHGNAVRYEADGVMVTHGGTFGIDWGEGAIAPPHDGFGKLRPSLFMCRWMTRLDFVVTESWAERLHDITDEEALLEGIEERRNTVNGTYFEAGPGITGLTPVLAYQALWEVINGGGSWAANPKVWRVGFRRMDDIAPPGASTAPCAHKESINGTGQAVGG